MLRAFLLLLALLFAQTAFAVEPSEVLKDPATQAALKERVAALAVAPV